MPIEAWRLFSTNFDAMTDDQIEQMVQTVRARVLRDQTLLEAVADWKAAGSPRSPHPHRTASFVKEERATFDARKIIEIAAGATDTISNHIEEAQQALRHFEGRTSNGYGIFSAPSRRRADLARAKAALDAAWEAMNDTSWPDSRDYEAHGR